MLLYGSSELAESLVRAKLIRRVRGGWRIPDYLDYNPSGQQVAQEREAKTDRQRRWRETKKRSGGDHSETRKTAGRFNELTPVENSQNVYTGSGHAGITARQARNGRRPVDASTGASRDASVDAAPTPPRPAPKEAGRGRPDPKPPWCGECDERTRLAGDPPGRCAACHPLAPGAEVIEITDYRPAQEGP
jgi:hypothetical protein